MAALVPSTSLYGAELFPTSQRSRANGIVGAVGMVDSVIGLLGVGYLVDRFGQFGPAIAIAAVGPVIAAALILTRFPETAQQELEALNPENAEDAENAENAENADAGAPSTTPA